MNEIGNIENEELITGEELAKSHFNEDWHNESMNKIEEEKNERKKSDMERVEELTKKLFENEKMPINDFIEKEIEQWKNGEEIVYNLIINWYSRNNIINSSLDNQIKEWIEIWKKNIVKKHFLPNAFRFKDNREIDEKLLEIVRIVFTKWENFNKILKQIPAKRAVTIEDIENWIKTLDNPSNNYELNLIWEILPDLDWTHSKEVFRYLNFDEETFSRTSKEHLPDWFDPEKAFDNWMTIGLWIDDVHKMWYTWKWVSIAVCDSNLKPHADINVKEHIIEWNAKNITDYFHASAVCGILAWKKTWIAPDADIYYFAEFQDNQKENWWNDLASALNKIYEKNKQLSNDKKIRVVSISGPLYGGEETEKIVKKLEDSWVWVLSWEAFITDFWFLDKKNPTWDPNDFNNYELSYPDKRQLEKIEAYTKNYSVKDEKDEILHDFYGKIKPVNELLFVNSGDRTIPSTENETAYMHDSGSCTSWAIPVVSWYYTLACQADPTMTPKRFKQMASETAIEIESNGIYKNFQRPSLWRLPIEQNRIKVIDIKALIQKIEEEKNK